MHPLPTVRAVPLEEFPTAYPQLRFAVRFPDGRQVAHRAGTRHPLAGTGKLVLACVVASLAERNPGLLGERLTLTAEHRAAAHTGTLRLMSSELRLTVDDAMALVAGTGDGACVLAMLEHLAARGVDVPGEARGLVAGLDMADTAFSGLEPDVYADGASWGEGLVGETTPADLCTLLDGVSERVLDWMGASFEPAGLASALPGFGPRTVPHHTVAGWELTGGPVDPTDDDTGAAAPGYASVLALLGTVVAAYHPATHPDGAAVTPLEVSTAFGTLGLAVWNHLNAWAAEMPAKRGF